MFAALQQRSSCIQPLHTHHAAGHHQVHQSYSSTQARARRQQQHDKLQAYTLQHANGSSISINQATYVIGSSATADLQLQGQNIAGEHAELRQKGKQVFLKALQGETVFDKTYTWIDEAEARPAVSYVLASGSKLAFGDQAQCYTIEFEEPSGANPLVELMMKGMAASADPEVQKELST